MSDATTTLLPSWEEKHEDGMVSFSLSGDGHCAAIIGAVREFYNELSGRPRPTTEDLENMIGEKVTLIQAGSSQFGAAFCMAQEGTLFAGSRGGVSILPKRAKRKGFVVQTDRVIDVLPGFSTAKAQELVDGVRGHFPSLRKITRERLEELPHDSNTMSLAVFGTRRMPEETVSDAVWLFSSFWREDDILDKAVLLIRPSAGFSETGSEYGRNILNENYGEVIGFTPISFSEAAALTDLDFDEAYSQLFGNALTPA